MLSGMAGVVYLGFDRSQALAVMQMHGIEESKRRDLLDDLRIMEAEALPILNKR